MPPKTSPRVLLFDRDPAVRRESKAALAFCGFLVEETDDPSCPPLSEGGFDAVLFALDGKRDPGRSLRELQRRGGPTPVIIMCDPANLRRAVAALELGAEDYLMRPANPVELRQRLGRILERQDLSSRLASFQNELSRRSALATFEARSPAMRSVLDRVLRVAPMRSTVLVFGESGVGKELVARTIHFNSRRREAPFIALNCAAIPAGLIESELFGHEKGAFTGAHAMVRGKFEIAHTGTLFLDEIGEMDPATQARLLRVLEQREFMRVGGDRSIGVDVRVLAATNADLEQLIAENRFRRDLYYRLKVVTLAVPPLRERGADLPSLVRTFIEQLSRANAVAPKTVSPKAMAALMSYDWPGNVRELKNLLESLLVSLPGAGIRLEDLPGSIRQGRGAPRPQALRPGTKMADVERELIRVTLEATGGNRTHSAAMLGIGVRTLQRKIQSYGLSIPSTRRGVATVTEHSSNSSE